MPAPPTTVTPVRYFLIGDKGTNIFKLEGLEPYILNDRDEWEFRRRVLRYLLFGGEYRELTLEQAKSAYSRITRGKAWIP